MNTAIVMREADARRLLIPSGAGKDHRHRLARFVDWLEDTGQAWVTPDLAAYRDHLRDAHGLAAASILAHLSTVRGRYRRILNENGTRDALYSMTPPDAPPSERKAYVDEFITRLENAIDPAAAPVEVTTKQDRAESEHLRLTSAQATALIEAPGVDTLLGLRDTAVIVLMLCTGVREAELCALDVSDLRQKLGGELALLVRKGKGSKQRLVPYGALDFCLAYVDAWRAAAGVEDGPVFRGLYKGGRVRNARLAVRSVCDILSRYPIVVEGRLKHVKPHDCRRTYARRLYEAGLDLVALQQNLGHADLKTTLHYVGALGADKRRPPAVYAPDLSKLAATPRQARLDRV